MSEKTVETGTAASWTAVLTALFRGLAKLLLMYGAITLLIWWLIPLVTAGAVVLTANQALAGTALLILFHGTRPVGKSE